MVVRGNVRRPPNIFGGGGRKEEENQKTLCECEIWKAHCFGDVVGRSFDKPPPLHYQIFYKNKPNPKPKAKTQNPKPKAKPRPVGN